MEKQLRQWRHITNFFSSTKFSLTSYFEKLTLKDNVLLFSTQYLFCLFFHSCVINFYRNSKLIQASRILDSSSDHCIGVKNCCRIFKKEFRRVRPNFLPSFKAPFPTSLNNVILRTPKSSNQIVVATSINSKIVVVTV